MSEMNNFRNEVKIDDSAISMNHTEGRTLENNQTLAEEEDMIGLDGKLKKEVTNKTKSIGNYMIGKQFY